MNRLPNTLSQPKPEATSLETISRKVRLAAGAGLLLLAGTQIDNAESLATEIIQVDLNIDADPLGMEQSPEN